MATRDEALAELYRRGALKGAQKAAFEELARRGAVPGVALQQQGARTVEQTRGSSSYGEERARVDRDRQARINAERGQPGFDPLRMASDFVTRYDPKTGRNAFDAAIPLRVGDEIAGAGGALAASVDNLGRLITRRPMRDVRAAYQAAADAEDEAAVGYRKAHPFAAGLMETASGLGIAKAAPVVAAGGRLVSRSLAARGGRLAGQVATGAATGAVGGAAYGFAESDGDFDQRIEAGKRGGVTGAIVGGGASAALPVVASGVRSVYRTATGLGRDAVGALTRQPLRPGELRPLSDTQAREAEDQFFDMLAQEGVTTPEAVQARVAELAEAGDVRAMDILGRRGVQAATAIARRPGQTAERVEAINRARQEETAGALIENARTDLGVNPETAREGVEAMVERGQRDARPAFDRAWEAGPQSSPKLDELLARPDVADALPAAVRLAKNEGVPSRELGLRDLDATPDGLAAGEGAGNAPPLDPLTAQALDGIRKGVAGRLRQGPSLQTWLSRNGGVSDAGGDLRAMGMGERGAQDVRRAGGLSAEDRAPQAAYDAGFFPDMNRPPTPDEFRAALVGPPRYARKPDPAQADLVARMNDVEERLASAGIDPRKATDAEIADAFARQDEFEASLGDIANREPLSPDEIGPPSDAYDGPIEPVRQVEGAPGPDVQPTPSEEWSPRALHYVKRSLDNKIANDQRASVTGRLSPEGRVTAGLAKEFRDELRRLNGAYGEALDLSGDYLSLEAAYNGSRTALTQGSVSTFQRKWAKATPGERNGIRAALGNTLLEMAEKGLLRPNRVTVPGVGQKLAIAFGDEGAAAFVQKARARARLNANSARVDPRSNSTTGEVLEFNREADLSKGLQVFAQTGRQLRAGNYMGAVGTLGLGGLMKLLNVARTTGAPVQVRDELGRLLTLEADELAELVRQRAAAGAIEAPRRGLGISAGSGFAGALMAGAASE